MCLYPQLYVGGNLAIACDLIFYIVISFAINSFFYIIIFFNIKHFVILYF